MRADKGSLLIDETDGSVGIVYNIERKENCLAFDVHWILPEFKGVTNGKYDEMYTTENLDTIQDFTVIN